MPLPTFCNYDVRFAGNITHSRRATCLSTIIFSVLLTENTILCSFYQCLVNPWLSSKVKPWQNQATSHEPWSKAPGTFWEDYVQLYVNYHIEA